MVPDDDKPNPIEDVRKGLGLLFRAAKTAAQKIPTQDVERVVRTGAREVTKAVETATGAIERAVFKKGKDDEKPATDDEPPKPPPDDKAP